MPDMSQLHAAFVAALPVLLTILAYSLIGAVGTAVEKLGERRGSKFLIDFGQRLEALGSDGPKLKSGSRITKLERDLKAADTSLPEAIGLAKREGEKRSLRPSDRPPSTRSITPIGGGSLSAALVIFGALALLAPSLHGCSSHQLPALPADGAAAREVAKGVHRGAVLVVRTLDQLGGAWVAGIDQPTAEQFAAAKSLRDGVARARDVLNAAAPIIEDGGTALEQLREAAALLEFLAGVLHAQGVTIPREAAAVVEYVSSYAGARS